MLRKNKSLSQALLPRQFLSLSPSFCLQLLASWPQSCSGLCTQFTTSFMEEIFALEAAGRLPIPELLTEPAASAPSGSFV